MRFEEIPNSIMNANNKYESENNILTEKIELLDKKETVAVFGFFIGYVLIVLKVIQMTNTPIKKTKKEEK